MSYQIHVVLVKTLYPLNVGAVSRAMSNMGAHRLIMIDRQCELDYSAQQAAATGQDAWQNRTEYKSLKEFYAKEGDGLRIALTARDGRSRAVTDLALSLRELKSQLQDSDDSTAKNIYLFFGPEDAGLSAEDMSLCHHCCSLPTFGANWSLNLAQAVLLALFILRSEWGGERTRLDGESQNPDRMPTSGEFPEESLREWLEALRFDLSKPKVNAFTVLKRLILHSTPTQQELRILESVIHQTIRKLKE